MSILLAVFAAVLLGVSDYTGGRLSRTVSPFAVALLANAVGLIGVGLMVPVLGDPLPGAPDLAWGALAGVSGVAAVIGLYWALAHGSMSVVAPATSIVSAGVPIVVGLVTGDRPSPVAVIGMAVGLTAIALIAGVVGLAHASTAAGRSPRILAVAALAGAGFGLLFVAYGQTSEESGVWPLAAGRAAALPLLLVVVLGRGALASLSRSTAGLAVVVGLLGLIANIAYLAAVRQGLLSVVAVVVSLYPASTVLLATWLDGERMSRSQFIGLWFAATALVLVTLGN